MASGDGSYSRDVDRLGAAIDAIARKCWRGLPALMGQAARPSLVQIADALKVCGVDVDAAFILEEWPAILEAVRVFISRYPDDWALYREFIIMKETSRARWGQKGAAVKLAEQKGIERYEVYANVRSVPRRIAALYNLTQLDK